MCPLTSPLTISFVKVTYSIDLQQRNKNSIDIVMRLSHRNVVVA